ncbi:MAG: hypothetical protein AAGF84_01190 [Planctomycetota bacterium]
MQAKQITGGNAVRVGGTVALGVAVAALAGCNAPSADRPASVADASGGIAPSWTAPGTRPTPQPAAVSPGAGMVDPIAELQRQRSTQLAAPSRPVITPEVMWGEPDFAASTQTPTQAEPSQVFEATVRSADQRIDLTTPGEPADATATPEQAENPDTPETPQPLYAGVETLTQSELLDELHRRLTDMDAPPMRKALATSGLALIRPGVTADEAVKAQLDPTQAELLERFEKLVHELARRIEAGDLAELDAAVVTEAIEAMQGPRPLTLRNAKLCKRVSGFGVYTPFPSTEFVAGREHRAIVYAEVDHFVTHQAASGGFEVQLEQEVTLFNEADGLAVWTQPAQTIQDVSQRKRRDFYNVQMVTLPANLGVGRYRMKVRVTDVHGGTVDEATLPISLIADDFTRGVNDPESPINTPEPELSDTQRDLLRTLAPGLFTE